MKSKEQKATEERMKAMEIGRFVSGKKVRRREAEGWKKVIINGEPEIEESATGQKTYLMVPPKG